MRHVTIEPKINLRDIERGAALRILPHGERSKGLHLTNILQRIRIDTGESSDKIVFGRNMLDPIKEEDLPLCMALGMAVEDMILRMYPWLERISEIKSDGVAMSSDAVSKDCKRHLLSPAVRLSVVLHEIKTTWKSSNKAIQEFVQYLRQVKSYCRGLGTQYAVLHIVHVNGDYTFGATGGPRYIQHHLMFDKFELESNWSMLMRKKKDYKLGEFQPS